MLLEEPHRLDQQVIEVERVRFAQQLLVTCKTACHDLVIISTAQPGILLGSDQLVLRARDGGMDRARGVLLLVQVEILEHALHQPLLVVGVVDREVTLAAQVMDIAA